MCGRLRIETGTGCPSHGYEEAIALVLKQADAGTEEGEEVDGREWMVDGKRSRAANVFSSSGANSGVISMIA